MSNSAVLLAGVASIALHRQFETRTAGSLKHPEDWLRESARSDEELIALGRSYQHRPINLILISPDGTVREGNSRLKGILLAFGPDAVVQVCVTEEEITPAVSLEIQLESSEHTRSLTPYEQYAGYSEWLKLHPGATARELAQKIHRADSTVSKALSLGKCGQAVHDAAKSGLINPADWYAISQSNDQEETLRLKLSGEIRNRAGLERHNRKAKKPVPAVRTAKIKVPLVSGAVVTVAGEDVSLEEAIEAASESVKMMKQALAKGLNVKTAVNYWKDLAAAGI